jgi:hypothetical protein
VSTSPEPSATAALAKRSSTGIWIGKAKPAQQVCRGSERSVRVADAR